VKGIGDKGLGIRKPHAETRSGQFAIFVTV
jgi:hypothetical protein